MIGKIILFIFLMAICYFIYKTWCEFADRFEYQVMKHNIIGEVSDLHVYLENDK